jgi:hypothetical protein
MLLAKKINLSVSFHRRLVKNYQPKKKDEEDYQ